VNPQRILDLANAFWGSAALLAANECGLFAVLANDPLTLDAICTATGLPARPTQMLLDALVALGLMRKDGERYGNAADAQAFLVPGKPGSLAGSLRYNAAMFPAWARLAESVRGDHPVVESPSYLGVDAPRTRGFVMQMHARALALGPAITAAIDLSGCARLLDVGGGPGTLSVLLCQRTAGLAATVLEVPAVAAVGKELVAAAGLADRVTFTPGDAFAGPLGAGYDAALVSGLLHREPAEVCAALCRRLRAALQPGAKVYLVDVMRDESRVGPAFAALFGLNMLLTSERGGCHATVDHAAWLRDAGFVDITTTALPPPMMHSIVSARAPI